MFNDQNNTFFAQKKNPSKTSKITKEWNQQKKTQKSGTSIKKAISKWHCNVILMK